MANNILHRTTDPEPLVPLDKKQLGERLLEEMGPGFQLHESKHYVVVFNTTRTYAKWCSSLLERLQRGFLAFWTKKGCDVYARPELGPAAGNAIGYYSFQTNRIVMYDLTGIQALRRQNTRRGKLSDITLLLSQPQAEPLVATIVHEATHQISFNCGLQTRFADNPVWLGEGLAVFFETPDLSSNRSWSGIGKINYARWDRFRDNVNRGRAGDLRTLIADDSRIRNPRTALDAYAEAWAWTYFLIKWHPDELVDYLKMLSEKPLLMQDDRTTRVADFRQHFGDLQELEKDFYRRMSRLD